ncbi:hypothetical protein [Pseudomonas chlororaphis]|nr:hypothetical protein [Pseudomonas chlororaphis]
MSSLTLSSHRHTANASCAGLAAWVKNANATVSFYFGYWFSHWRA